MSLVSGETVPAKRPTVAADTGLYSTAKMYKPPILSRAGREKNNNNNITMLQRTTYGMRQFSVSMYRSARYPHGAEHG